MVSQLFTSCSRVAILLLVAGGGAAMLRADDSLQQRIDAGREQFVRVRPQAKMRADGSHHTERFFNARSCAECHKLGGIGGAGPNENNVDLISVPPEVHMGGFPKDMDKREREFWDRATPKSTVPAGGAGAIYGFYDTPEKFIPVGNNSVRILHRFGTMPGYDEWRLALLRELHPKRFATNKESAVEFEPVRSSLSGREPSRPGMLIRPNSVIEERNTPPLFGLGEIAKISQIYIDAIAAKQSAELKGRMPRLPSGKRGRFGWKSQTATLPAFNEGACGAELGLRTENVAPSERLTMRSRTADDSEATYTLAPAIDMTSGDVESMTIYIEALPRPRQVVPRGHERDVASGKYLFEKAGCAVCHVPDVGEVIGLYSDLLLHRVGTQGSVSYGGFGNPAGSDFDIVEASEFRTPPLWGLADSAPYLHDGSAPTIDAAVRRHQGQARQAFENYRRLSEVERSLLLEFLGTLRSPAEPAAVVSQP